MTVWQRHFWTSYCGVLGVMCSAAGDGLWDPRWGNGNASPQGDLRRNALFLCSEGVSIAGQAFCYFHWVFNLSGNISSHLSNKPVFHCLFLAVTVLLCLLPPPWRLSLVLQSLLMVIPWVLSCKAEFHQLRKGEGIRWNSRALHWPQWGGWSRNASPTLLPALPLPTACHSQPLQIAN